MTLPERDHASGGDNDGNGDGDLLDHSYLTYLIPHASNFGAEKALRSGDGQPGRGKLASIEQRDVLFFDETVDVYIVLRAPCASAEILRPYLPRLVITLDAQIVNGHAPDRDPPASESIYNGTVEDTLQAIIVEHEEAGDDEEVEHGDEDGSGAKRPRERYAYAVWKLPVFLARPRIRLQAPSVVLSASAGLKPPRPGRLGVPDDGYMESGVPSGLNLLQAFADDPMLDPMLGGAKPRLSALRVSRVAPVTQAKEALRRFKGLQSLRLKIYPVAHTRVRFARPNTTPPSSALIAMLEVDFTPFFECEVSLDKISLAVTDGSVENLNSEEEVGLPLNCVAHDHLTFLYRLAPRELDIAAKNLSRDLVITIDITVLVRSPDDDHESDPCTPRLSMTWTTNLDFTLPLNPGFGQPLTQPIQRAHRPSQLSIGGDAHSLVAPSVSRPDALPSLEAATARTTDTMLPDFGITVTFSGPDGPVYVGEEFRWTVFVMNRSGSAASGTGAPAAVVAAAAAGGVTRRLALVAIPRRRRNELRIMRPPSTAGAPGSGARRDPLVADAVLDENVVHAMQRSSVVDSTEIVCLSADVRVGPLAPNACAVVELRFLALREGVVGIEAIRVIDLGSQEHVDVRELPTTVVVSRRSRTDGG
ncbi:TRAPP trafficking subunit Trs65-domain-containing protein [Lasiosphaeria miniovina]|uniref:TRAPP trafficking subunit Trs65-domain-containing protein n=1 Tax=Lasiosphaeria miniovina TaxID=1954250 RepID=A0AA39ZU95_9PEZI|nr:TRAPP trafficking subunit Trs65-domain-containing protein [Lasiosphaeria miniovina]KAK0703768.1 TRAPP trafficking subunit Trs65-domain-containing protein [Lasiosphaeria miniovina]